VRSGLFIATSWATCSVDCELQGSIPYAGSAYLVALAIIHVLTPRLEQPDQLKKPKRDLETFHANREMQLTAGSQLNKR